MKKPLKTVTVALVIILLIVAGVYAFTQESDVADRTTASTTPSGTTQTSSTLKQSTAASPETTTKGRYQVYSEAAATERDYTTTIVFFYAPWCPECRAFKQTLSSTSLPTGVQILQADFDSSTSLKKKYGVTLQSSFVRINSSGDLEKKWSGYGKEKTLSNVLMNLE